MRRSHRVGIILAIALVVLDLNLYFDPSIRISMSAASAHQTLPSIMSTTTLPAATDAAWSTPQPVASTEAEIGAASLAAPSAAALHQRTIAPKMAPPPPAEKPARLIIPSIDLDTTVIPVGVNAKGEMDVPDGGTSHVGWFKGGPLPGQMGSAVIDAHVFAAFENLRYVKVGEDLIVETVNGVRLRFVVNESIVYKLSELEPHMLFGRNDARRLTLITCAGVPVGDTYSHRLVVYAKFVEVM